MRQGKVPPEACSFQTFDATCEDTGDFASRHCCSVHPKLQSASSQLYLQLGSFVSIYWYPRPEYLTHYGVGLEGPDVYTHSAFVLHTAGSLYARGCCPTRAVDVTSGECKA